MNRHHIAAWALSLLALAIPARALDFTTHHRTIQEDGFTKDEAYFQKDAGSIVIVEWPRNWNASGGPAFFSAFLPDTPGASIKVENAANQTFDPATLEIDRKRVLDGLPNGSTDANIVAEKKNALPFFQWTAYEFIISYNSFGQNWRESVSYINRDAGEAMVMTVIAPAPSFEGVHSSARAFLLTWHTAKLQPSS